MKVAAKAQPGLSAFLNRSDGIDAEQALARAELHLSAMRETIHSGIEDAVSAIGAHITPDNEDISHYKRRELYQLSDGILSVASMYDKESLGKVAYSLCDLLSAFEARECWDSSAVRLHYDTMRLLQASPNLPADAQQELIRGLEKVVRAFNSGNAENSQRP